MNKKKLVYETQYEMQRRLEPCRRFEFAECCPDRDNDIEPELEVAKGWYDWFVSRGISTAIERRPVTTINGRRAIQFIIWREGPRWMMKKMKPANQVIVGELIAVYDPKGVFEDEIQAVG